MISNSLKSKLDLLKPAVAQKINAKWNASYADVITFLIEGLLNSTLSYEVKKFSVNYPIKSSRINLSYPVKKTNITYRSKIKSVTIN